MTSHGVLTKTESNSAERPGVEAAPEQSLFGPEPVRVRDLIGEIALPPVSIADRKPGEVIVTPARRGGPLRLSWYDYGVVALVVVSLVAGVVCLLRGV